jgi:hypothetical protein
MLHGTMCMPVCPLPIKRDFCPRLTFDHTSRHFRSLCPPATGARSTDLRCATWTFSSWSATSLPCVPVPFRSRSAPCSDLSCPPATEKDTHTHTHTHAHTHTHTHTRTHTHAHAHAAVDQRQVFFCFSFFAFYLVRLQRCFGTRARASFCFSLL